MEMVLKQDIKRWKDIMHNDFEKSLFPKYPELAALKENLYEAGAVYASMTGSGSAVYGIFEGDGPANLVFPQNYLLWKGLL